MDAFEDVSESNNNAARENYDKLAATYDSFSSWEKFYLEKGVEALFEGHKSKGGSFFELGFGTGTVASMVASKVERIVGIDISEQMAAKAKEKLPSAEFIVSNFLETNIENLVGTFDFVFASFVLELFEKENMPIVLSKLSSLLKLKNGHGGRMVVVGMSKEGGNWFMQGLYSAAHSWFPNTVDCR